jgi:outer membrane protein assembly factor BamB
MVIVSWRLIAWESTPCNSMADHQELCRINVGSTEFEITDTGLIRYRVGSGNRVVKLSLPESFEFEVIRHAEAIGNVVYFSIEITNILVGATIIFAIDQNAGKILWQTEMPAFNSSPLLIENSAIYAAGIGYVAKLDTKTGKYIWSVSSLYEKDTQAFNGFKKPTVENGNVIYTEDKVSTAKYSGERSVVIKDVSGELVSK